MRIEKQYNGLIVPMTTPFTGGGKVDEGAIDKIISHLEKNGAIPLVLGTTGEDSSIQDEERIRVVKRAVKASKNEIVYAGISNNAFGNSVNYAKTYFDLGIKMVMAHLPNYYPIDEVQMLNYYEKLADAVDGPLLLYNIPITVRMSIPFQIVQKLSEHPNIIGIKDSERDMDRLRLSIGTFKERKDFSFFVGWGSQIANGLILGTDGIMPGTANFIPSLYKYMQDLVEKGETNQALGLQEKADQISAVYQKDKIFSNQIASLKVMMSWRGLCEANVLPPLLRLGKEKEHEIYKLLDELKDKLGFE